MTEPSTGAGGTAVGITVKPGDIVWIREQLIDRPHGAFDPDGAVYIDWNGVPMYADQSAVLPDHPALRAVAAWLNANPDGAVELWAHLDDLGEERETPRLLSLRDALGDALATDGGA